MASSMERAMLHLSSVFLRKPVRDDDFVDRLHHSATLILLLASAAGTALQEYAGEPINCWTPSTYPQEHYTQHVNEYCWTHPLRYPESSHEVGVSGSEATALLSKRRLVNFGTAFYRWVTLIFVLQAVLFKLPSLVWGHCNRQSGASLTKLRDLLTEAQTSREERAGKMDEAATYLHAWLADYRSPAPRKVFGKEMSKLTCLFQGCGRRSGQYMCVVYLAVKLLYLLNVVGNFVLLSVFLDAEFWQYGVTVVSHVLVGGDWHDPVNFPRLLICDFRLHHASESSGTPNTPTTAAPSATDSEVHTVQCVLSINQILEKLFVLQWFWLVALTVLTVVTFVTWSIHTVCGCAPHFFARKYMKSVMYRGKREEDFKAGQRFVRSYLRQDGIFVLRMLEANSGHMMVKELVQHLWDNFQIRNKSSSTSSCLDLEQQDIAETDVDLDVDLDADADVCDSARDKDEIV